MQLKPQGPEPLGDGGPQLAGLVLAIAVRNNVVRLCRLPYYADRDVDVLVRGLVLAGGAA
jgi:hypothetical protein